MTLRKRLRPSRLALRIYLIGLVQFVVVACALEIDHRMRFRAMTFPPHDLGAPSPDGPPPGDRVAPGGPHHGRPPELFPPEGAPPIPPPSPPSDGRRPTKIVRHHPPGPPWLGWPIGLVLVVVGVGSFLTARSISRPLARLTKATRAFGSGQLDARAKMERADEIGEVSRAFDDMADRIAKLLLAERELLANVSHELRTPLARIRVALDLANEAEPHLAVESLKEIAQDLGELERIVDDVLASARLALDAGGASPQSSLPVRAELLDAAELLERSAIKFRAAHPERPLDVSVPADLGSIMADAVLVRRVVDNLLDNAHKYTEAEGAPIALSAKTEGESVLIEVRDRGIGITEADLERLFEPFFRADRSRTRATGGLGLGLALSRRVVDAHKGTIVFESKVGEGTTARVRLPRVG